LKEDIFSFWSRIADDAFVHPDDKDIFARVRHTLQTDCLPICFVGPLRTAKIVLLFLSPGYSKFDTDQALTAHGQSYYRSQRMGDGRLPSEADHALAHKWWTKIVRQFDPLPERLADQIAVLNIGAYHSVKFNDWHMLTALPSSRVALDYAQQVLFPKAEQGERVVVCLRSARLWGLSQGVSGSGECYGQALFVPATTQGGIMHRGDFRNRVVAAVRSALDLPVRA